MGQVTSLLEHPLISTIAYYGDAAKK